MRLIKHCIGLVLLSASFTQMISPKSFGISDSIRPVGHCSVLPTPGFPTTFGRMVFPVGKLVVVGRPTGRVVGLGSDIRRLTGRSLPERGWGP